MTDIAIKVENISKKYQIGENKTYPTLRDKLMELPNRLFKGPKKTKEFWALRDVSFEVKKGEVVGIIGRNGAGKSTMLKILARITEPTSGKVTMYGRVASMLEVGTGFNPELTGRENIYLNGAIIGMTKREITQKFDEIVAFSGVEKFLDTPVKHYSSGMYVRLAFAVASHLDADILLVDEVLAVGDAEFQKKCLEKMSELANSGKTIIFISHNSSSIKKLCTRAILLRDSRLINQGMVSDILSKYASESHQEKPILNSPLTKPSSNNIAHIVSIKINANMIDYQEKIVVNITYEINKKDCEIYLAFAVLNNIGDMILFKRSFEIDSNLLCRKNKGLYQSIITIPGNTFAPGTYFINVGLGNLKNYQPINNEESSLMITILDDHPLSDIPRLPWRGYISRKLTIVENTIKAYHI